MAKGLNCGKAEWRKMKDERIKVNSLIVKEVKC